MDVPIRKNSELCILNFAKNPMTSIENNSIVSVKLNTTLRYFFLYADVLLITFVLEISSCRLDLWK